MYDSIPIYMEPTFWLSFFYLATGGIVIFRIILMKLHKDRWLSYNSGFLFLCLVTCLLRTVFFMFYHFWMGYNNQLLGLGMYWFATNIQFATFSLLVVFYASITNSANWSSAKIPTWIVYTLFNLLFLGAFIGSLLVVKIEQTRDTTRSAITAATFFVLVIALGYYGFRVWRILLNASNPDPKLHGISAFRLFVVTLHIMVIYLSRSIYAVLSDVVPSLRLYFGAAGESMSKEVLSCIYVAVWEIVPIVVILILFWSTNQRSSGHYNHMHTFPYLSGTNINTDTADEDDLGEYEPVPTLYTASSAISYPTGRESTSLLPSSLVSTSVDPTSFLS